MAGSAQTRRSRHWFNISEAASCSGVSPDTGQRRLRAGAFPSAVPPDYDSAAWRSPVGDLIAAGLTADPVVQTTGVGSSDEAAVKELRDGRTRARIAIRLTAGQG